MLSECYSFFWGLIFFLLNFTVVLSFLLITIYLQTGNNTVVYQTFSELIFFYPLALVSFLILAISLYICSVFLGGKAPFGQTVSVMGLSSFPLLFIFISYFSLPSLIIWGFFLAFSFQKIHHYSLQRSVLSIIFPFLVIIAFMLAMGLLNISFLEATISSFIP